MADQENSPLHTVGFDARFPQQNQTKHCWQSYVDYHKCINMKGEDFAPCKVFWKTYNALCPLDWIEKWDDQREKVNEEYVLLDDPRGETKIAANSNLLRGKEFLVRAFTLTEKGNRKFMLATEPARMVSYLPFQTHPNINEFIINETQKDDIIDCGVLRYPYRNRQIVVTARGVIKEFDAKSIRGGKNITDDYYSSELRTKKGGRDRGTLLLTTLAFDKKLLHTILI